MLIAEYSLKDYREITEEHYCLRMGNLSGIKWLGERGGGGGGGMQQSAHRHFTSSLLELSLICLRLVECLRDQLASR